MKCFQSLFAAVYLKYFDEPQRESCLSPIYHRDLARRRRRGRKRKNKRQHIVIYTHNRRSKQEVRLVKKIVNRKRHDRKRELSMFTKNNKENVHTPCCLSMDNSSKTHCKNTRAKEGVQLIFISDSL